MKRSTFFLLALLSLIITFVQAKTTSPMNTTNPFPKDEVIMHPIQDAKTGMVSFYIPLPASWKVSAQGWEGPGQSVVQEQMGGNLNGMQGGIPSMDQLIQYQVLPRFQQAGLQAEGSMDLPEVAAHDQQLIQQYWQAVPTQRICQARGIEYTDQQGRKGLAVLHYMVFRSQYGSFASYYFHTMVTQPQRFEQTKKEMLYALANFRINPQYLAAYNQREQQKSQASWAAHNNRMRARQQQFNSWQQTQQTYSDINDINMQGWENRNRAQDRMQDMTVDGIWEREAVTDPYTGQQRKVDAGYDTYHMNQWGEYIGTNDAFYNPNMDPSINNQDWQQARRPNDY